MTTPKRLGILGAMTEEVALLASYMSVSEVQERAMRQYHVGTLSGQEAVLVFSRWGKVAAASTVTTLIEQYHCDMIVMTGVAGAADPSLSVGDCVIGDCFVQHDLDTVALGMPKFSLPLLGVESLSGDPDIVACLETAARDYIRQTMPQEVQPQQLATFGIQTPRVVTGTVASGDQFIAQAKITQQLREQIPNLQCVEMEGAAVAQVCYEHGVPFGVFRVISDKADMSAALDFTAFVTQVAGYFTSGVIRRFAEIIQE